MTNGNRYGWTDDGNPAQGCLIAVPLAILLWALVILAGWGIIELVTHN